MGSSGEGGGSFNPTVTQFFPRISDPGVIHSRGSFIPLTPVSSFRVPSSDPREERCGEIPPQQDQRDFQHAGKPAEEVDHLARDLKQNGYPVNFICNTSAPPTQESVNTSSHDEGQGGEGTTTLCDWHQ